MGEHAVVYGAPALLSAIDRRLTVTVKTGAPTASEPDLFLEDMSFEPFLRDALRCIHDQLGIPSTDPVSITIRSQFPPGYHLGSSAAVAVSLAGALMYYRTGRFDAGEINRIAYEVEKLAHGTPSGGDNTTVTYGGFIRFRKLSETEKTMTPMTIGNSGVLSLLLLVDTGKPESTRDMVAGVRALFQQHPEMKPSILMKNEEATEMAIQAIVHDDTGLLVRAIRQGERTLEDMGVVSPAAAEFIRFLEKAGGAGKILGGGGRTSGVGYMLCFVPEGSIDAGLLNKFGYTASGVRLGEEGVRIEPIVEETV